MTHPATAAIQRELTLLARHSMSNSQRGELHLDRSGYQLLSRLELQSPMSLKELAVAFGLDVSTVNRQVRALQDKGLVRAVLDPDGGAARKFEPTRLGMKQLSRDRAHIHDSLDSILDAWSVTDRKAFATMLTRFNESVEQREGRPWPRS